MSKILNTSVVAVGLAVGFYACKGGSDALDPHGKNPSMAESMDATGAPPKTISKLLGQGTFTTDDNKFKIKRETGDWDIDIKSSPGFDIAVQDIIFPAGSSSGWHTHPGPVFIQVIAGTMTFYQTDDPTCSPIVKTVGEGYLDLGLHPHIAVNESGAQAENLVVYLAPPKTTTLKFMASAPPNCAH